LLITLKITANNADKLTFTAPYKSHWKFIFRHTSVVPVTVNVMALTRPVITYCALCSVAQFKEAHSYIAAD